MAAGGNSKKHGRWKRCPSNLRYAASGGALKNARKRLERNWKKIAKKRAHDVSRMSAGKPQRGAARAAKRNKARGAWKLQAEKGTSLSAWIAKT